MNTDRNYESEYSVVIGTVVSSVEIGAKEI